MIQNLLKYLPYITLVSSVVTKFKAAGDGKTAVESAPGSVDGHHGQFLAGFVPDSDAAGLAALHSLEGVSLDL